MAVAPAAPFALDADVIGVLVLAVFAFLAINLIDSTRPGIVGTAGSVPLVGGPLGAAVDAAIGTARGWLYNGLAGSLTVFSETVQWVHDRFSQLTDTLTGLGELAAAADLKIVSLTVPALIAQATAALQATEDAARAVLSQALMAEESARAAAEAAIWTGISDTQAIAAADVNALAATVTTEIDSALSVAEAYADAGVAAAEAAASGLVGAEHQAMLDAITALGIATGAEVEGVLGQALAGDSALEQILTTDLSDLRGAVGDLQAILAGAGVGALAAVVADVAAIRALRCIQNCNSLGDLGDLLTALDPLLLIAFAAAWRADQASGSPSFAGAIIAAAQDIESGVASVANP